MSRQLEFDDSVFQNLFGIAAPEESIIDITLQYDENMRATYGKIAEMLHGAGMTPKKVLGGVGHNVAMSIEENPKAVIRIGRDNPTKSEAAIASLAYMDLKPLKLNGETSPLRITLTLQAPDVSFDDGPYSHLDPTEDINERKKDLRNTVRFLDSEGKSSFADGIDAGDFAYLKYHGEYLRYPTEGVLPEYAGRPIAFLRDLNSVQPVGESHSTGSYNDPERIKRQIANMTGVASPLEPIAPEDIHALRAAFQQQNEIAREVLEELGMHPDVHLEKFPNVLGRATRTVRSARENGPTNGGPLPG
ncbi:MAG TPA: hypothetical protein VFT64_08325 [Rickettsiales bacterium]|nr:hypothetical protein [Rickettsiales bacterium]